jgi:hypothetical protein
MTFRPRGGRGGGRVGVVGVDTADANAVDPDANGINVGAAAELVKALGESGVNGNVWGPTLPWPCALDDPGFDFALFRALLSRLCFLPLSPLLSGRSRRFRIE